MSEIENMIQHMADRVRHRNMQSGSRPGKPLNAPAVTLYPNILAEIEASGMYLWCPAQHADVSEEIMAAVLEDGEDMTLYEVLGLCRFYGCKLSYMILAPLQVIDPTTHKGKARRRVLADMLKQADGLDFPRWRVETVLDTMGSGQLVTYAAYRCAKEALQNAIDRRRWFPTRKQKQVRRPPQKKNPPESSDGRGGLFCDMC